MPKKPQAYYRPQSVAEALALLAQPHTVPLAGGTRLLAAEAGLSEAVVDLQDLGLDALHERDGQLTVGAMVTLASLARALPAQAEATGLLQTAIKRAGPNTYRNAATLGGVTASRLADSELLAALLVLEAVVHFADSGRPPAQLEAYLGASEAQAGLIAALSIPWRDGRGASERVARTPADYPIVAITAWQPAGEPPRLAATGIAARPLRLPLAEQQLVERLDEAAIAAAAAAARATADHPGDFRGDAAYRAEMAAVLTSRVLRALAD